MRMKDKMVLYCLIHMGMMGKRLLLFQFKKKQQCLQRDFNQAYNYITYQLSP